MKALLVVDMQNDFMPGGPLGVPNADTIIPLINTLIPRFPLVVATQDWHPQSHCSFAANHPGKKPGDTIDIDGIAQILWPVHCVQNTPGAALVSTLAPISTIFHKGTDPRIDSYSAFFDNARRKSTGLGDYLRKHHVTDVYLAGVATDYCVLYSTLDAIDLGFTTTIISDACKGINLKPHDIDHAFAAIAARGGKVLPSALIPPQL